MQPTSSSCSACGLAVRVPALRPGQELRCPRCASTIRRADRRSYLHATWALASTGLVLCVLANLYPVLTFEVAGNSQATRITSGVAGLAQQGYWPVAGLVLFCATIAPALHFAAVWYVAGSCCQGGAWPHTPLLARLAEAVAPWSLVPVFAVACMVAVVKLEMLGHVTWDLGMVWVTLLAVCSFALSRMLDLEIAGAELP